VGEDGNVLLVGKEIDEVMKLMPLWY